MYAPFSAAQFFVHISWSQCRQAATMDRVTETGAAMPQVQDSVGNTAMTQFRAFLNTCVQ